MSELRERQRLVATQAIVDATAALVTERRHFDFSMKEVAERAGVSLRTVYNYFPDRSDLLDALGAAYDAQAGSLGMPQASDLSSDTDFAAIVRSNHRIFEQLGGISEAIAQMPLADVGRDPTRTERTDLVVSYFVSQMPSTPDAVAHPIGVLLRHLISHRSWFWLTREYGLSTEQVAELVVWATDALTAAAESGHHPNIGEIS